MHKELQQNYDDTYECCRAFFYPKHEVDLIETMDVETKAAEGEDGMIFYRIDKISH